ncbi:hypothetical protein LVJ94_50840 [Pendulispora rubella]|uniref:Lipoprotein n=1 Tax=Pendulispora rubella TaxID=2741070 RepID=A0ABZ2L2N4_9BACT
MSCAALAGTVAACADDSSGKSDQPVAGGAKGGEIHIYNKNTDMGSSHEASANFYAGGWTDAVEAHCETTTEGSCIISRCQPFTQEDFARPTPVPVPANAGTIEIRRSNSDKVLVLDPIRGGLTESGSIWSGGEDIFIKASGDPAGVPAFETTLKAPSMITVSVPGQTGGKDVRIPRSKDLDVTWTREGAAFGTVKLVLGGSARGDMSNVACTYPVESGAGKVPASVLGSLAAGNGGLRFDLTEERTVEIDGGWKVRVSVRAGAAGLDPQGLAGGNVIFE